MKHFVSKHAAINYLFDELVSTLCRDLEKMEGAESELYANNDCSEMIRLIADVESLEALIKSAPEMHKALKAIAVFNLAGENGYDMTSDDAFESINAAVALARATIGIGE